MAQLQRVNSLAFSEAPNYHDSDNQIEIAMEKVNGTAKKGENGYINPGYNGAAVSVSVQVPVGLIMDSKTGSAACANGDTSSLYSTINSNYPDHKLCPKSSLGPEPDKGDLKKDCALEQSETAAVVVMDACKSFKSRKTTTVLHNLCMTVRTGTIYSLLGSSGCGKTTLLQCIVGMKRLDSGRILVFGCKTGSKESGVPGKRIGYMPQDLALYGDLSIQETISYFGSLYGMKKAELEKSREFLMNLLSLPEDTRRVSTLSGGQKRRVSLAVSLINAPPLIILDEPTVGVDPLLRDNIWKYLMQLVSNGKTTVIITTHYIDEARQSDTVGVMRGGRLLSEKSPPDLFEEFKTSSLEEVVLTLCNNDEKNSLGYDRARSRSGNLVKVTVDRKYSHPVKKKSVTSSDTFFQRDTFFQSMRDSFIRIKSLAMKNAFVMIRNIFLVLFVILLPALQTCVMGMSMGNDPKPIKVGVVNYDYNFTGGCNLSAIDPKGECAIGNLSCRYLRALPPDTITLTYYDSEEVAREEIRLGTIRGFMMFGEGYSDAMYYRSTGPSSFVENETLQQSYINFEMDASNAVVTKSLQSIVFESYKNFVQRLLSDCGLNPDLGGLPIKFRNPIYGKYDLTLREYVAAGMLVGVALFFPLCSSSITYIWDKKQGTMERARVAGTQTWEIMMSYFVTEGTVLLMQTFLSIVILVWIFQITIVGSPYLAILLLLLNGFAGISLGLVLASICNEEIQAIMMGLAIIFPNFFLAGAIWPIEGMPLILQYLSYALPGTLACEAFRAIVVRGWGFFHFYVWIGFASTFAWLCFYWILAIFVHKMTFSKK